MTTTPNLPTRLLWFIQLGRPLFLAGGVLMHLLGVAISLCTGTRLNWQALLWGQVAITAIQWMTSYSNEYFDLEIDRANCSPTRWAGGSRVLTDRLLPPRVALLAAIVLGALGLGAALILALVVGSGPLTLPLIVLALLWAWSYSAPPVRLEARSLGELSVALLVPGLTPLMGYYLQAGRLDPLPNLAAVPLCFIQIATQLSTEFSDAAGDAAAGKRTLVVRLGGPGAARLHALLLLAAYGLLPILVLAGLPSLVAGLVCLSAPVAVWQGWRVARGAWADPARWNSLAFWGYGLVMGTTAAEVLAFLLLKLRG